jgi:hypothetical protein
MLDFRLHRSFKFLAWILFLFSSNLFGQEIDKGWILRRFNSETQSLKAAGRILNDEIYVGSSFAPYSSQGPIHWNENPYRDETWCFYFQSMDMIGHLANAYEVTSDEKYLHKAQELIQSWNDQKISFLTPTTWLFEKYFYRLQFIRKSSRCSVWDDHSAANRVTNLIQFYFDYKNSRSPDHEFLILVEKLLEIHGKFLADPKNYNDINNHGIFQDRSLLQLVKIFPKLKDANQWHTIAVTRLSDRLTREVSPSGVHKEHSPSYHIIVLNLLKDISMFLQPNDPHSQKLADLIYKMEDYLSYVIEPNGSFPNIGDSSPDKFKRYSIDKNTNPNLVFLLTQGKKGTRPKNYAFYKDAGVAIFRDGWFTQNPFFLMMTAAFHSRVHKHADDLSFIMHVGSTDFLVDSGKYNYNEEDPYRKYFRSSMAHNTISVNGASYPIESNQIGKSSIQSFGHNHEGAFVTASHDLYKDIHIQRTLMYAKIGFVLIHDQITSEKKHVYSQNFQIGSDVKMIQHPDHILLKSTKTKDQINLVQLTPGSFSIYTGSENPIQGWLSKKFNKKTPISTVQYTVEQQSAEFKTILHMNPTISIKNFMEIDSAKTKTFQIEFNDGKSSTFTFEALN